jgi:hypothetical protein
MTTAADKKLWPVPGENQTRADDSAFETGPIPAPVIEGDRR